MIIGSQIKLEDLSKSEESPAKMLSSREQNDMDEDILNGAQNREKNFQLQINDKCILQEQQRKRLNTQDSFIAAPQTPEIIKKYSKGIQQASINNFNQSFFTSPSLPFQNCDIGQKHKSSLGTITTGKNEIVNVSNNFYNMKTACSYTPQTLKIRKESNNIYSGYKLEDENMKSLKEDNNLDQDIKKNNLHQINLQKDLSFQQSNNNFINNPQPDLINYNYNSSNNENQENNKNQKFTIANHLNLQIDLLKNGEQNPTNQNNFAPLITMKKVISTNNNQGTEESEFNKDNSNSNKARDASKASQIQRKSRFSGVLGIALGKSTNSFDILKNINIMKHARQFMNKLLNFTIHSNFKYLKQKHFDFIGDLSAFYNPEQHVIVEGESGLKKSRQLNKSNKSFKSLNSNLISKSQLSQQTFFSNQRKEFNKFIVVLIEILKSVPVFDPESFFFIIWDLIMLIFQTFIFLFIPLAVSFQLHIHIPGIQIAGFSAIAGSFFFLDTILTLNRGVYVSGVAVLDRNVIFKNYLKNILFTDFVTLIALSNFNQYLQLLILFRIYYIKVLVNRLDDHFSFRMRFSDVIQLAQMVVSIIIIAHLCACGIHLVSRLSVEISGYQNALIIDQMQSHWINMYIICLYFSLITMSTVGYGDVIPKNNVERIYIMVMTLLSSALFGYVINTIGQIYTKKAKRRAIFEQKKFDIITYMGNRNIPKHLQMKSIKYLEYIQFQKDETHIKGQAIIDLLPSLLSQEIKQEFFGKILHSNKFFNSHFSPKVINKLALKMKELSLAPGEFLIQSGQNDSRIYFLLEGCVSIYVQTRSGLQKKIVTIEEKNYMFGQRSFFCQQARTKWLKCEKTSNFAFCELKDFKEILLNYPAEYEVFCEIKDSIVFEEKSADTQCASCDKFSHNFSNCPLIHLKLNKSKIIYSLCYSEQQVRQKQQENNQPFRCKRKLYHSFRDRELIRSNLKKIRIEYAKQQLLEDQKEDAQIGNQSMTKFLIQEEIKSYEQYTYRTVEDKQFFLGVPEIQSFLQLSQTEEQYLQNEPYHQIYTSDNEEEYDADEDIEDYFSSHDQTANDNTIENLDITNDNKSEKIINQVANFSLNPDKNSTPSINSISTSQQKIDLNNTTKQNIFSKALINTDESTFELRKNNASSTLIKVQQDDQVQFNVIPHYKSEQSIQPSLKEPQQFQYTKQQSSQSVKFSQNQVYSNQSQANKDPQIQQQQQGQHQNQLNQQSLPQVLNDQILKLICQAMQLYQNNQGSNQGNNISNNQSNFTIQQPASSNIRRLSFQRTKTRKGTHKKSVAIMRSKTFKQTIQPILANAQNIIQVDSHQLDSQQKQRQQQFYFFDFEQIKNMVKYFPKYNMQNVVNTQNKYFKLRMNSIRKSIKKENNFDNRSPTFIGRSSNQQGLSPTRKRKEQRSNAISPPFQLRCKQVKQTVILQN
ncbi:hypothetical protein ABPG72_019552 [Tetrahymena utriculariae]